MKRTFTKYPSNYVKASKDTRYPYYIDNYNQFSGYVDNDTDVFSLTDLGFIYDTLVSDDDPVACSYDSFDSWLDSLIDSGALSGCLMSDAQRSDMPYEFGGYEPEWGESSYDSDDEYYDDDM